MRCFRNYQVLSRSAHWVNECSHTIFISSSHSIGALEGAPFAKAAVESTTKEQKDALRYNNVGGDIFCAWNRAMLSHKRMDLVEYLFTKTV